MEGGAGAAMSDTVDMGVLNSPDLNYDCRYNARNMAQQRGEQLDDDRVD